MKYSKIEKELFGELKKEAKKMGKNISWFRFAKKTKHGYRFLTNKESQWEKLEEIAKRLLKKYPEMTEGEIIDLLSYIVNT